MPYVLGDLLGAGGMGRVFTAQHPERPRVAIKLLHEALASDATMVARLREEALAAQSVRHANVVRVYEYGVTSDGIPFIAMERHDGISLGTLVQQVGLLPLPRVRRIVSQILAGLAAIHRADLVHGDMKSDNIIVGDDDRVTIIDFGLARRPTTRPSGLDEQLLSGTPEYMAPETIRGEPATAAADLYAVGIILYEMLTGTTPFGGGTTATAVFERHLNDDVVPPSLRCADRTIPVSLEAVIMRALEKDASARHLNAELFSTAIERAIPTGYEDRIDTGRLTSSTTAPTREWSTGKTMRHVPHPRRRFAEGTVPRDSMPVALHRQELAVAIAAREFDVVVAACLALAEILVNEHRLVAAARELEAAISWVGSQGDGDESLWRLQLTLAAIYDGLGDRDHARRSALEARDGAKHAGAAVGYTRAQALLGRYAIAPQRAGRGG